MPFWTAVAGAVPPGAGADGAAVGAPVAGAEGADTGAEDAAAGVVGAAAAGVLAAVLGAAVGEPSLLQAVSPSPAATTAASRAEVRLICMVEPNR
ncbi:hypothetical protein DR950_17230 [Kitasatospora xanthocidica]|uniref:Uncharacterized protein n=1 Tax=Kitasatospora xanthocidica TaxID=83382 RepID=A0A372ZUZ4_9ACTN|nr:hypothetical protein DR950_17230 [Kitasatospora xanthocidica]